MNTNLKNTVEITKNNGLCISCELCFSICPKNSIEMKLFQGQYQPFIKKNICIHCGLCLKFCSGIDIRNNIPYILKNNEATKDDFQIECYITYCKDYATRENSTSGGIITKLLLELIKNNEYHAVFILPETISFLDNPQLILTNKSKEILKSAKSKYCTASLKNVIEVLSQNYNDSTKYVIVGTPCQLQSIKNIIRTKKIDNEILFFGLFCDRTMNLNFIKYMFHKYKKRNEQLKSFIYRTKEGRGWPGNMKLEFKPNRSVIVDKKMRMELKQYFQLERCLYCTDKINPYADVSFGDCYIPGEEDFYGKSTIIINTKKGKNIWKKYDYNFISKQTMGINIWNSQSLSKLEKSILFKNIFFNEIFKNNCNSTKKDVEKTRVTMQKVKYKRVKNELLKRRRYIKWGRKYNTRLIKISIKCLTLFNYVKKFENRLRFCIPFISTILKDLLINSDKCSCYTYGKNIVIFGGQLFNKGAQAMTFITINNLKKKYPGKEIYIFSHNDSKRAQEEIDNFNFKCMPWNGKLKSKLIVENSTDSKGKNENNEIEKIDEILKDTCFIIDISGYRLSSQFSIFSSLNYMMDIIISKKYKIPYYIFPQSIGPFNFPPIFRFPLYLLIKNYLQYPEKIYVREIQSLNLLKKIRSDIERRNDIVLFNKNYDLKSIFKLPPKTKEILIQSNTVGIVPNDQIFKRYGYEKVYKQYNKIIDKLLSYGFNIYLLPHSNNDITHVLKIKEMYLKNNRVQSYNDDLYVFKIEEIIKQFVFLIGSRYHSIIHAYKNEIPAIVMGWALKYQELTANFKQSVYYFDMDNNLGTEELLNKIEQMAKKWKTEKRTIKTLLDMNKDNLDIWEELP